MSTSFGRSTTLVAALAIVAGACVVGRRAERPPDERFGHRYSDEEGGNRETMVIRPPDSTQEYFHFTAPFDTVHVRPAPFETTAPDSVHEVPVEVLVKGSLPDACVELHHLEQERMGHLLRARLQIRRPRGAVCATVIRPYRFYFMLPDRYEPGHYTLNLNDRIIAFRVLPPPED